MQEKLLRAMDSHFKQIKRPVKDEEMLFFLDSRSRKKFDRELFYELTGQLEEDGAQLSPYNFSQVYLTAYKILKGKQVRAVKDLSNLESMARETKKSKKNILRVSFRDIEYEHIHDVTDYVEFVLNRKYKIGLYNLSENEIVNLYIPDDQYKSDATVILRNEEDSKIDEKTITLTKYNKIDETITFSNKTKLAFSTEVSLSNKSEVQRYVKNTKMELTSYLDYTKRRLDVLVEPFRDVFLNEKVNKVKAAECSGLLKFSIFIAICVFLLSLGLNYSRCLFIDIFVCTSFFGNVYVWRQFNLFLGLKLIGVLVISIIIDLAWEIMKLVHFTTKLKGDIKTLRIIGLTLSFVNIVLKIILAILFFRLSRENQDNGYLAVNDEISIDEVDERDYLVGMPEKDTSDVGVNRL